MATKYEYKIVHGYHGYTTPYWHVCRKYNGLLKTSGWVVIHNDTSSYEAAETWLANYLLTRRD